MTKDKADLRRIDTKRVKNFRNPGENLAFSLGFAQQKFLVKSAVLFCFFFGQAKKIKQVSSQK